MGGRQVTGKMPAAYQNLWTRRVHDKKNEFLVPTTWYFNRKILWNFGKHFFSTKGKEQPFFFGTWPLNPIELSKKVPGVKGR